MSTLSLPAKSWLLGWGAEMPIYVSPIKCDYLKWAMVKTWTLYQTACILSGVEPILKCKSLCEETSNVLDAMKRAIETKGLQPVGNYHDDVKFYPIEVIRWAEKLGMDISEVICSIVPIHSESRSDLQNPVTENAKNRALHAVKILKKLKIIRPPQRVESLQQAPTGTPVDTVLITQNAKQQSALTHASQNSGATPGSISKEHWHYFHDDPLPAQPWYTPARYYARQLLSEYPTLKRDKLSEKVAEILKKEEIFKRGGINPLQPDTILKAFTNVDLAKTHTPNDRFVVMINEVFS